MQTSFSVFLLEEDAAEGDDAAAPPDVPLTDDTDQVCVSGLVYHTSYLSCLMTVFDDII